MRDAKPIAISAAGIDAAIFDLDGVVTDTARTHAAAWKTLFDDFLMRRDGAGFTPFSIEHDYLTYVDGRPRYEGVRAFCTSRGIDLPDGDPSDAPGKETICGLGNAKNLHYRAAIEADGVIVFDDARALIDRLRAAGVDTAIVTASKNADLILEKAGLAGLFEVAVTGVDIEASSLRGKPEPDSFLEAARRLKADPARCAVFEDALVGVEAGRAGGFGLVVGVDRDNAPDRFLEHGADAATGDLGAIAVTGLPSALDDLDRIAAGISARKPAVFLDYDGTLTPIVSRPELAHLSDAMRAALNRLNEVCPVAIVSGRDLADIQKLAGLQITTIADHGFELAMPGRPVETYEPAAVLAEEIGAVADAIENEIGAVAGVLVERKRFSVAVHYRLVEADHLKRVHDAIDRLLAAHPRLRIVDGKMVREFRPDLDWDKGKAVLNLADRIGLAVDGIVYIGDDVTDEDVFRELRDAGTGIIVWGSPRRTAASYCLPDIDAVQRFLTQLAERLEADDDN